MGVCDNDQEAIKALSTATHLVNVAQEISRVLVDPNRARLPQLLGAVAAAQQSDPQRAALGILVRTMHDGTTVQCAKSLIHHCNNKRATRNNGCTSCDVRHDPTACPQ
jgi:hypothetical protein